MLIFKIIKHNQKYNGVQVVLAHIILEMLQEATDHGETKSRRPIIIRKKSEEYSMEKDLTSVCPPRLGCFSYC